MIRLLLALSMLLTTAFLSCQSRSLEVKVVDSETKEALIGATVYLQNIEKGTVTDIDGLALILGIDVSVVQATVSFVGYKSKNLSISLTSNVTSKIVILENEEMEEVIVRATRSTRTIQNLPTRVEFINEEELQEKAIMNAANISLVLRESTGIQMQQSSLSSGNQSIRIQGLDGRFTQLLKDGFPLFGGFSGGLSVMQLPPLDLSQFEIIKGSSSTLYGGGAISGLVNMVSKTPNEEHPTLDVMLTQTHAGASTANIFYANRSKKIGYTLYGAGNCQRVYDPDGDDFSNLPDTKTFSINPKLFIYPNENSTLWIGLNANVDKRNGGDVTLIKNGLSGIHQYFENSESTRISTQASYETKLKNGSTIQVKNSISLYDRLLSTPTYVFDAKETNSYSEISYASSSEKSDLIIGANIYSNSFDERDAVIERDQKDVTFGIFANQNSDLSDVVILESGLRVDHSVDWGAFVLPRVSLLWKASDRLSTRIGGGLGYKVPDIFTEQAAMFNFENVNPINKNGDLKAERSYGLNWDVNYRTVVFGDVAVSINQLFYLTNISNSLLLLPDGSGRFLFDNADGLVQSRGAETNVKFSYESFRWFANYALIDTRLRYLDDNPLKPLTARHNAGTVLMYESSQWRIGLEAYYTGPQLLSDESMSDDYIMMGLLIQKHFSWGSPYVNFENFTDIRQSKFSSEVLGAHEAPVFPEIYAPTDGAVFSIGAIFKPFK